jgi:transposase
MPAPLPPELRERVMDLLAEGVSPTEISTRLRISRQTVYRYRRAAQAQGQRVPEPKAAGGYRWSKLKRDDIVALAQLVTEQPKITLKELNALAQDQRLVSEPISDSTVARALHKTGLKKRKASYRDLRTVSDPLIARERRLFREAQRQDPVLAPNTLLWMDETNVRLGEQATRAWGVDRAVLFKPKGQSMTTGLFLTLGVAPDDRMVLHWSIKPPARPLEALSPTFEASELEWPGRAVDVGLSRSEISKATVTQLRAALRQHGVK